MRRTRTCWGTLGKTSLQWWYRHSNVNAIAQTWARLTQTERERGSEQMDRRRTDIWLHTSWTGRQLWSVCTHLNPLSSSMPLTTTPFVFVTWSSFFKPFVSNGEFAFSLSSCDCNKSDYYYWCTLLYARDLPYHYRQTSSYADAALGQTRGSPCW